MAVGLAAAALLGLVGLLPVLLRVMRWKIPLR
jgi:hypothetical protein